MLVSSAALKVILIVVFKGTPVLLFAGVVEITLICAFELAAHTNAATKRIGKLASF